MSSTLSKIVAVLLLPSSLAALALLAGLWLMSRGTRPVLARRLAWGSLAYLVLCGMLPVGNALILPLEQRFASAPRPQPQDGIKGIIILGGFEDGWVSAKRGGLAVNEAAERLTEGLRLARQLTDAKVIFTGGVGTPWRAGSAATGPIREYLELAGIEPHRIVLEGASRSTHENALLTAEILKPLPGERWALVTSAYHMPRAVGLYRKAGFDVIGYPVDYRTRGPEDLTRLSDRIPAGLQRLDTAVAEWLGLLVFRITGRIDEIFPGP